MQWKIPEHAENADFLTRRPSACQTLKVRTYYHFANSFCGARTPAMFMALTGLGRMLGVELGLSGQHSAGN